MLRRARSRNARGTADRVYTAEKAPDPLPVVGRRKLRPTPAAARKDRIAKPPMKVQSGSVSHQRRDHRNLLRRQLRREGMLLGNGGVAPTAGPIKLGDHRIAVLDSDLVDPILIAVESQSASVAAIPKDLERIQYRFRRKFGKRRLRVHRWNSTGTMSSRRCRVP